MTGRLRITHLLTNAEFAGTERYVVDVSRRQAEVGHDVSVIGGKPAAMTELVDDRVRWAPGATPRDALREVRAQGRRDIVHSHVVKSDFVGLMAAPATRAARISTRHITAARGFSTTNRRLGRVVRRLLASEIAVSRWTSEQLERPADVVLLNGVRSQPDTDGPRDKIVLVAQRLAPEKDTPTTLHAWARSGLGAEGWRLRIAGDGPERAAVEAQVRELGVVDSVDVVGWVPDLTDAFRTSGLFLATAPTEPCGLSVLEAMSWGLPVVAANAAGFAETVGSLPGGAALFPAGDADAAARLLVELAHDEDRRRSYGAALRVLQRDRFSIDVHVAGLDRIYSAALART